MARDYAKRPKKKATRKSARSGRSIAPWTWLLTGLLIGLVVGAVAYLKINMLPGSDGATPPKQATAPKSKSKSVTPAPKAVAKAPTPPKFDFYTLLPEMEVAISEPAPAKAVVTEANDPVLPHPLEQAKYRLQLASFKHYDDADSLKAKLAMTGHIVEIHSIKLDSGAVWYRVYTPVLPSREQAVALQKELQNQAISSMLLKAA